jgi:hypothetical protein
VKYRLPLFRLLIVAILSTLLFSRHCYSASPPTPAESLLFAQFDNYKKDSMTLWEERNGYKTPLVYKDSISGIVFLVESDRRHVDAIDKSGKLLWSRDPFVENHLKPYRVPKPLIKYIGPAIYYVNGVPKQDTNARGERLIVIGYTSSQFGVIDVRNGDFTFIGQD